MALEGTIWLLNEQLTAPSSNLNVQTSNISLIDCVRALDKRMAYGRFGVTSNGLVVFARGTDTFLIDYPYIDGVWQDPNFRLIVFETTGNVTFTPNESTIETWLLANATKITSLLAGTTWMLNKQIISPSEDIEIVTNDASLYKEIKLVKKNEKYGSLYIMGTEDILFYEDTASGSNYIHPYTASGWHDQSCRLVSFGDMNNVTLSPNEIMIYQWLGANAIRVKTFMISEDDIKVVADAIRSKTSISGPLQFPDDFASQISEIQTFTKTMTTYKIPPINTDINPGGIVRMAQISLTNRAKAVLDVQPISGFDSLVSDFYYTFQSAPDRVAYLNFYVTNKTENTIGYERNGIQVRVTSYM